MSSKPIGVFDSGIGGLTVVKEIKKLLPNENIVYFGDTARVPYGNKSEKVVKNFAMEDSSFLLKQNVKCIVAACNTVSAVALADLQNTFSMPVVGVVRPGAAAAVTAAKNSQIGVIGTSRTIASDIYRREIQQIEKNIDVYSKACPLFVPLAEEGWEDNEVAYKIAGIYLNDLKDNHLDTLVLGCTHYPVLESVIQQVVGPDVTLINSAASTAVKIQSMLKENNLTAEASAQGQCTYFVSDVPHQFREIGERFLGSSLKNVTRIDLEAIDLGGYLESLK